LKNNTINYELIKKYTPEVFIENKLIPLMEEEIFIKLLTYKENYNFINADALSFIFQKPIKIEFCEKNIINNLIQNIKINNQLLVLAHKIIENSKIELNSSNYTKEFLEIFLNYVVAHKASDIHIEVQNENVYFRVRIDGILYDLFSYKIELFYIISALLKVLSQLDVANTYQAQDGRFSFYLMSKVYDFRISFVPTINGYESIVIRILDKDKSILNINNLGLEEKNLQIIKNNIAKLQGLIIITGATGSGKTTTMYAIINELEKRSKKIITIEDPVEYEIEGIVQINVDESRGLTFSSVLKNILRQDPDVILIGEIRDKESLDIAIGAALTGHLVITTLHTQNTIKTIDRLFDLGAKPFLVASVLKLIMSQKLIRKLCDQCRESYTYQNKNYFKPIGCEKCNYTGYSGRELILELLEIDERYAKYIREEDISSINLPFENTIGSQIEQKVTNGFTSLEEYFSNEI
jgi:general secretion pathway protein E